MLQEFATVPEIIAITFFIGFAIKRLTKINNKIIPVITGIFGGIFGVLGLFIIPSFPADNFMTALTIGIASGLAATGVHQIGKQIADTAAAPDYAMAEQVDQLDRYINLISDVDKKEE